MAVENELLDRFLEDRSCFLVDHFAAYENIAVESDKCLEAGSCVPPMYVVMGSSDRGIGEDKLVNLDPDLWRQVEESEGAIVGHFD